MLISTKRIKTLYSTFIKIKYHEQSQACLVFLSLNYVLSKNHVLYKTEEGKNYHTSNYLLHQVNFVQ